MSQKRDMGHPGFASANNPIMSGVDCAGEEIVQIEKLLWRRLGTAQQGRDGTLATEALETKLRGS